METVRKVVLLVCGAFNPVTNMHLRMFELARDTLHKTGKYSVIKGIISPVHDGYQSPSKKKLESAKHRVAMLEYALETSTNGWVKVDAWESKQNSWLPTLQVLEHIQQAINNDQCSETLEGDLPQVKFLCGGDLLESFSIPGLWQKEDIKRIICDFGLVVITREGSDPEKFIYESDILTELKNNIIIIREWIYNDISSTKVRRALRRNESIKYIVPDPVINYITEHNLYKA